MPRSSSESVTHCLCIGLDTYFWLSVLLGKVKTHHLSNLLSCFPSEPLVELLHHPSPLFCWCQYLEWLRKQAGNASFSGYCLWPGERVTLQQVGVMEWALLFHAACAFRTCLDVIQCIPLTGTCNFDSVHIKCKNPVVGASVSNRAE